MAKHKPIRGRDGRFHKTFCNCNSDWMSIPAKLRWSDKVLFVRSRSGGSEAVCPDCDLNIWYFASKTFEPKS